MLNRRALHQITSLSHLASVKPRGINPKYLHLLCSQSSRTPPIFAKLVHSSAMADKTPVVTENAPRALPGIYSQAIKANGFVFVSGAVPMDPVTMKIIDGDIQAHTHQCIKNLSAILEAAGSSLEKVVKVNVFISDMDNFAKMNEVYSTYWGDVKPCRTCVAVKTLPLNTDVEIECTATY
ncbi:endoribonuclease L-PSP [Xylariaceae sp. FL0255]|nr:endoribonuclease L-PSP [Xylariaceae sp. FL0255]